MLERYQFLVAALIPSVLVVLSWIHNNTRLSRLEAGLDATNRRLEAGLDATNRRIDQFQEANGRKMDELIRGFHNVMMSFQAAILSSCGSG